MNRRTFAKSLVASLVLGSATRSYGQILPEHPLYASWEVWKAAYLGVDGRVVDGPQGSASHSESQGFGLCLAAFFGDRGAFNRIYGWTEANLRIRDDMLLAWRWLPDADVHVPDRNNASDGDLFYAWGLMLGSAAFGDTLQMDLARRIVTDLVAACIVPSPDGQGLVMLPAAEGFREGETITINPSYYMPRAMRELSEATGDMTLRQCHDDGLALMERLAWNGTIPDWVAIDVSGPLPTPKLSNATGYEAMRVPLYLLWSRLGSHPAVLRAADAYRGDLDADPFGPSPTIIDPASLSVTERSPDPGYGAIRALVTCAVAGRGPAPFPPFTAAQPYYPGTLHLMALLAQYEGYPQCYPL
ncbi:MAG: glycosyl hydrolase family 8 [Gemmobacter sp.]|nr:glycosyl hydrolase family 8 [Gemmobacter sp.]